MYYAGTLAGIWDEPGEEGVGLLELRIYLGWAHEIVSADQVDAEVSVLLNQVWKPRHQRTGRAVHSLKRMDFTDHFTGIHL